MDSDLLGGAIIIVMTIPIFIHMIIFLNKPDKMEE